MADTTTPEGRDRRLAEINGEKVERLQKLYEKTGDKKYLWVLQKEFGMDCDYIPGYDDGEEPKKNQNEE